MIAAALIPKTVSVAFASYEAAALGAAVAQTDPGSVSALFDLIVQNGLALSLAILLVVGAFTQRISFDGRDELQRIRDREKAIDDTITEIKTKLDRVIERLDR